MMLEKERNNWSSRSRSATHIQGSAMAATGEWRARFCCLELLFVLLNRLQCSYLYLQVGNTNSTNLGAIVSLPW